MNTRRIKKKQQKRNLELMKKSLKKDLRATNFIDVSIKGDYEEFWFRAPLMPDFLWSVRYWYDEKQEFWGTLENFIDKFRPSRSEFEFKTLDEMINFIKDFGQCYKGRMIELLRKGLKEYSGPEVKKNWTNEEVWNSFIIANEEEIFKKSHAGFGRKEYEGVLKGKEAFIEFLKKEKSVRGIYWINEISFRGIGILKVLFDSEVTDNEITNILKECKKYNGFYVEEYFGERYDKRIM